MYKTFILIGAMFGALSVAIGAFGAHGLKSMLETAGRTDTFETAVKYQFYHTFAILLMGLLLQKGENSLLNISGWLFLAGIIVFSGSLYALCFTGIRWLGAITPIGGVAFIAGWLLLAWAVWKEV